MKSILITVVVLSFNLSIINGQELKKEYINKTPGYTNIVSIITDSSTTFYIAGQVGTGNTMEEQIRSSYKSLMNQLKVVGATFSDVVKATIYVVDYKEEYLPLFKKVRIELFGNQVMPAITMVGVSALAVDKMKVEIEAIAILKNN